MKTKQRVLLVLLAAAVLLGAALWAMIRSNAKAEQAASVAAEGSIPLSSFAAEDLEQIEYTYNGQTYTLQYSGGSWQLTQDPAYHLDESTCNTMRTALMALNAKRSLTPQAGEDYGLDSPQLTVTVTAAGQSTTLTFGAENPVTGDLYVQKAGDDAIYTVSVRADDRCEELFDALSQYAVEGPHYFDDDAYTDMPEKELVAEVIREKALLFMRDEIPHGIAVVVERFKERPGTDLVDIDVNIYCERESHKGMVIGKGGAMLKKIASAARADCEEFLGCRINLQCWVKVKADWRDNEFLLNNFGFKQNPNNR